MAERPEGIHDHALSNLRYIREAMERATAFTSVPGWGGVWIGVTAVATAVIAHRYVGTTEWILIWLGEAVLATIIAATSMVLKARRAGVTFDSGPARRFFISYSAPIIAAAALTFVLARDGRYEVLPALWLLLYGASFVSSGAFSIRLVPIMGICFMALGFAACFVSHPAGNVLLGAGFGGLHVVFGWNIARSHGG